MKYLLMTADKFPCERVDVRVLLSEEMSARGHEIDWLMQSDPPLARAKVQPFDNGSAYVGASYGGQSRAAKAVRQLQAFVHDFRVFGLARRNRYDFIQVKDKFVGALLALLAARLTKTKFAYWLAFPFPEAWAYEAKQGLSNHPLVDRLRGWFARILLYRVILPRSDLIIVQSDEMKRAVAANGIPPERILPVPMGVRSDLLSTQNEARSDAVKSPAVLYLGSMVPVRRLDFVIQAFARVVKAVPDATLYMVGGERAEYIDALRAEAERLRIDRRVVFTPTLPRAEALTWVRAADVCLSPLTPTPILEVASSTKLVEYMALGKAVVGNHQPDQTLVIEESGGGLCVPYQVDAFADAVIRLLKNPELAREMGKKGREYVALHRAYPRIADTVADRYNRLVGAT
ncbi:MAG TPA: glycosyltransferase [Gammaproteobacteria bacterium]|nr:glycosyltransferase [Gammaproteobacteria bacterium]